MLLIDLKMGGDYIFWNGMDVCWERKVIKMENNGYLDLLYPN
jgi:hypothetical protein